MYNRNICVIFTLTTIRNNITAIICVWEIETKVCNAECTVAFVVVFPLFRSFSRFFNFKLRNLFKNMINYIFENLPVPVKHFCDPGTVK